MDFSEVFAGVNVSSAIAAIIGAGALLAAPGFARWLTDVVASFFDGDEAYELSDSEAEAGFWLCDYCGEVQEPEAYCADYEGADMCYECSRDDSRWA